MRQKSINYNMQQEVDSAIEQVQWPICSLRDKKRINDHVFALQTTRVSPKEYVNDLSSPYRYFNLGLHVGDCAKHVEKNRQYIQTLFPTNIKIQWFKQVHGNEVAEVSQVSSHNITADAAVTREKDIGLAIMTADCLPILLVSKLGDEIAAIHGGWRPLVANIINNTLEKMKTKPTDLYAWLGPCISQKNFEVGHEVKAQFVEQDEGFSLAFKVSVNGKYLADLHHIARLQLENLGIQQISTLPECTYANTDKYYSYRKNAVTGRMATVICLK
ncbi:peptidoglycan editing factor PgeF [Colwellia sp. MSW7]|uniref:Purine nucleoside phosphorylase n=1 Tax=Colwellia maritima TaxID=2912588 RepID=A0ABS9X071_9GAMM|nr:peptidoglycan editing factor PgeF [Colwellia maritima]MCI2283152.1 peptidoglycan editing factor PgeF [Colwellia maritima]